MTTPEPYGPIETTIAPTLSQRYGADGAVLKQAGPRTLHRRSREAGTEVIPQPAAVDAVVFNDVGTRTLTVRLSDTANGYTRLLWQQGWQALRAAEQAGWRSGVPEVWATAPGAPRVVHGLPGDGGTLKFHFPVGVAAYSQLISKPGLVAIATVDRGTHHILSVRFLNRSAG